MITKLFLTKKQIVFEFTSRFNKNKYHGFTLVELLVVIAIISILAGMLLPALENAITATRLISCQSRQKQVMLCVQMYRNDTDGCWATSTVGDVMGHFQVAAQYMDVWESTHNKMYVSGSPLMCPASVSIDAKWLLGAYADTGIPRSAPPDYFDGFGSWTGGFAGGWAANPFYGNSLDYPGVRKADPPNPSLSMYMVDSYREGRVNLLYNLEGKSLFRFRHGESSVGVSDGALNMMFADGHNKAYVYTVGGEIYPVSGGGTFTTQPGFSWW